MAEPLYRKLRADPEQTQQELSKHLASLDVEGVALEQQERRLRRHLLNEKKARLTLLLREGLLSEEAFKDLSVKMDEDVTKLQENAPVI